MREIGYSFDPGQVVLRGPDGRQWHTNGGGYQLLYPNATVDVAFDVAVEPEVPFDPSSAASPAVRSASRR